MSDRRDPQAVFQEIKTTYFPDWDPQSEWRLVQRRHLCGANGLCHRDDKQILIAMEAPVRPDDELRIIHEICHATTGDEHDTKWMNEMDRVAEEVLRREKPDLSNGIIDEIQYYRALFNK